MKEKEALCAYFCGIKISPFKVKKILSPSQYSNSIILVRHINGIRDREVQSPSTALNVNKQTANHTVLMCCQSQVDNTRLT